MNNPNYNPEAYEKKLDGVNELNSAYSSNLPSINITESQFADHELNNLYDTPQYKNIKPNCHDKSSKDTDLIYSTVNSNLDNSNLDNSNLDLLKKPKREFLDNRWLELKENTYNDNCKNCKLFFYYWKYSLTS